MTQKVVVNFALTEFSDVKYSKQTEIAFSLVLFSLINKFVYGESEYQRIYSYFYLWEEKETQQKNLKYTANHAC